MRKPYGIRFHLLLMYHMIPCMRNANFDNKQKFWDPFNIFGVVQDRNFIFGTNIQHNTYLPLGDKLPLEWACSGSRDLNLKFGTPSITFGCIKLCTPNFVC